MKKTILLISVLAMSFVMQATDVQLIVERMNNGGVVAGSTYRVYAQMPSDQHSLHIVFGDQAHPLSITTTAPFFQQQYSGYSAANLNQAVIDMDPTTRYDSWITLGYSDNVGNDMWDLGVDFTDFNNGGSIQANNGGWFLLPTDEKCTRDANGLVLIAQFTTTGVVTGTLNLQGWSAPQEAWRADGLTFNTSNAQVFGCTDPKASNYNTTATFDNSTCEYVGGVAHGVSNLNTLVKNESVWEVFPNPLRDNMLNIQFNNVDVKQIATRIDIIDMTGKLVGSHSISADGVLPGNRISISQDLAAGVYTATLIQNGLKESKTIVVEK